MACERNSRDRWTENLDRRIVCSRGWDKLVDICLQMFVVVDLSFVAAARGGCGWTGKLQGMATIISASPPYIRLVD